jgi:hypothetical protein
VLDGEWVLVTELKGVEEKLTTGKKNSASLKVSTSLTF